MRAGSKAVCFRPHCPLRTASSHTASHPQPCTPPAWPIQSQPAAPPAHGRAALLPRSPTPNPNAAPPPQKKQPKPSPQTPTPPHLPVVVVLHAPRLERADAPARATRTKGINGVHAAVCVHTATHKTFVIASLDEALDPLQLPPIACTPVMRQPAESGLPVVLPALQCAAFRCGQMPRRLPWRRWMIVAMAAAAAATPTRARTCMRLCGARSCMPAVEVGRSVKALYGWLATLD